MRHLKTIALKTTLLCVSGLGIIAATSSPAIAGGCGFGVNPALCQTGVTVNPGTGPVFDNMSVNVQQPMGYLRSINYQRAPHTSITRVHGMGDTAALSDFPSSFTGGCHSTSTAYCRQNTGVPVNVEFNAPQVQPAQRFNFAPQPPMAPSLPMMAPPLPMMMPSAPRTVAIGGGYDPSKFIPRQYGENTFTPGTVYAPTSFINRNPADAARVLSQNGYSTGGYTTGSFGSMNLSAPIQSSGMSFTSSAPVMPAPTMPINYTLTGANMLAGGPAAIPHMGVPQGANYLGSVVTGQTSTGSSAPSGNVVGGVDGSGGYWEKVSGLTMFGDTVATSVVCRRQAPQQSAQVVSPVYGVPQPIPTPVPYFVDVPYQVRGNVMPQGCRPAPTRPFIAPPAGPHMAPFPAAMPGVLPFGPTMLRPQMGPQFGGGFGHSAGIAPTVGQLGRYAGGHAGPDMRTGWTY